MIPTLRHRSTAAFAAAALVLAGTAACSQKSASSNSSAGSTAAAKVAFLMPDEASTRYELHDHPGFVAEMTKDCAGCAVLYNDADGDATLQQQQFDAALAQHVKAIVLDPVDSTAAVSLVAAAHAQGVKVIAYDRPIPTGNADFYVSYDNEEIGKVIAQSLVQHLKASPIPAGDGILEVNGSPTDAAAGLIKKGIHEGLAGDGIPTLAEYDTPGWDPSKAQAWVSGQIAIFGSKIIGVVAANDGTGGATVAAFKQAGISPVPPVTGNDATIAGLQLIITGDQYNTISKPSEVEAGAAADAVWALINGHAPAAQTTLFGTATQLFTPIVVTRQTIKSDIIDKNLETVAQLCTATYASACTALGLS